VPCFNEAKRLQPARFGELIDSCSAQLLFVDDGSRDTTGELLAAFHKERPQSVHISTLPRNAGKGEAVRKGLLRAIELGAEVVGYLDADLSTPPEEMVLLLEALHQKHLQAVLGARIRMLGSRIDRRASRHLLGRVFATAAAAVLSVGIHDSQCGAKVFRVDARLRDALSQPFVSRWVFDVELLGRLLRGRGDLAPVPEEQIIEIPLRRWSHTAGSRITMLQATGMGVDLARVALALTRWS